MDVSSDIVGTTIIVTASGSIDHSSAPDFEAAAVPALDNADENIERVLMDLSGVAYMSSVGLRVLMILAKKGKAKSIAVEICGLQPALAEIFQISRFDKIFPIHESREVALGA